MPLPNSPLDKRLQEFLEHHDKARRENKTIEALHEKQDTMMVALKRATDDRIKDRITVRRQGQAIKTMQHQIGLLTDASPAVPNWRPPRDEMPSGNFDVAAIAKAHKELEEEIDAERAAKRDEETWWRRQRWLWFIAAVMAVFGVLMAGCATYITHRIETIEKSISEKR